jgi:hypothetical protein
LESCHYTAYLLQLAATVLANDIYDMERPRSGKACRGWWIYHEPLHFQEVSRVYSMV